MSPVCRNWCDRSISIILYLSKHHIKFQAKEKEYQDKISEDAKDLEKMTNKQSLLLKKVIYDIL